MSDTLETTTSKETSSSNLSFRDRAENYLREQFPTSKDETLYVRYLWGEKTLRYRLNIYKEFKVPDSLLADNKIVRSYFVLVVVKGNILSHIIKNGEKK